MMGHFKEQSSSYSGQLQQKIFQMQKTEKNSRSVPSLPGGNK